MERKKGVSTVATGVSVALITSGCTGCNHGGAVDPPPPELRCSDVDFGQQLSVATTLTGNTLSISLESTYYTGTWSSAEIQVPVNLTPTGVQAAGRQVSIVVQVGAERPFAGSFRFHGVLVGQQGDTCDVTRTFTVTIDGDVTVAQMGIVDLPLSVRAPAAIEVVRQEGGRVLLRACMQHPREHRVSWTVTAGTVAVASDEQVEWLLPSDPGVYQAELMVDYGLAGFAFDTVAFEVS
jgi:hypothetical protein